MKPSDFYERRKYFSVHFDNVKVYKKTPNRTPNRTHTHVYLSRTSCTVHTHTQQCTVSGSGLCDDGCCGWIYGVNLNALGEVELDNSLLLLILLLFILIITCFGFVNLRARARSLSLANRPSSAFDVIFNSLSRKMKRPRR